MFIFVTATRIQRKKTPPFFYKCCTKFSSEVDIIHNLTRFRGSEYLVWLVTTQWIGSPVDRRVFWFGFLITYFWRYLERSGGVLIIMSFLRHVVLWWLETHSAPLGMITLPWAAEWVQWVTLCNVYSTYSGNENTVLGIAEKDDIRASGRWVVKVI